MSRGLLIALVGSILLLAIGVAGIGAYVFLTPPLAARAESEPKPEPGEPKVTVAEMAFFQTKNFVTDLADQERMRYADVTVALGLKDEASLELAKKLEPQIRDLVLSQLRQKRAADLTGTAGKERLAESLMSILGELLQGQLLKVFVTDLVVQ